MELLRARYLLILRARWLPGFAAVAAALLAGLLFLEFTNRYHGGIWLRDFQVFYRAGGRIISGDELFRPVTDGFYSFKYSPTAALLFVPFSLVPFAAAQVFYWLFVSALVLTGFYLSLDLIYPDFRRADPGILGLLLVLAAMIMGVYIWSELTLGQVNHLLLVSYIVIAWLFARRSRESRAANPHQSETILLSLIWAIGIFIKPFGLILLPYFVIKKRFREIAYFAGFTLLMFLLPVLFYGGRFLDEQRLWFEEITLELGNKLDLLQPGNHTLASVIAQYMPFPVIAPDSIYYTIFKLLVITVLALLTILLIQRGSNVNRPEVLEFAFILALVPLISYSGNNTFGLVELAVFLLLLNFKKLRTWEKVTAGVGFLLVGGNYYNQLPFAWGEHFYQHYDSISLISLGTILLLATIFMVRWRKAL